MNQRLARILHGTVFLVALAAVGATTSLAEEDWPEKGPVRDGRTLIFEHHELRWALPDTGAWAWRAPCRDESMTHGQLVQCCGVIGSLYVYGWCAVEHQKHWADLEGKLKDPKLAASAGSDLLKDVDATKTTTRLGVPVGNGRGCVVRKYGRYGGEVAVLDHRFLYHHGNVFEIITVATGGEDLDADSAKPLADLMAGLALQDLTPWVVGPCAIRGVVLDDRPQGSGSGEEAVIERDGFEIVKPPEMNLVPVSEDGWSPRISWEARSADPLCYVYFDLRTVLVSKTRKVKDFEETVARDRADHWKEMVADADVSPGGKSMTFKTKWGRKRCVGYELRGTLDHRPYVELGYVFKKKKHWYVVRMQFGGENAREHWEDLEKTLTHALAKALKI